MTELESATQPDTLDHARRLSALLPVLSDDFKTHHYAIVDLLDDDTDLDREQESLDKHEDEVAQLAVRLERFVIACSSTDTNLLKIATKRLGHLEKRITSVFDSISSLPPDDCLLYTSPSPRDRG